jgi:hypothetical protein
MAVLTVKTQKICHSMYHTHATASRIDYALHYWGVTQFPHAITSFLKAKWLSYFVIFDANRREADLARQPSISGKCQIGRIYLQMIVMTLIIENTALQLLCHFQGSKQ